MSLRVMKIWMVSFDAGVIMMQLENGRRSLVKSFLLFAMRVDKHF